MSGVMIAAPSSGSGKTTVTLGLLRALQRRGLAVAPGKAGPDYIDPQFHKAACGQACFNFDPWAMRTELLQDQARRLSCDGQPLVIEAMMGLFDGAADGRGSPADLAALLGLKVVLVVDCGRMSQSVAAMVHGYASFRKDVRVAGVVLNRVGSDRHEAMLRAALQPLGIPVLGILRSDTKLALPERHLGLVQAQEHLALDGFIEHAADCIEAGCDVDTICRLASGAIVTPQSVGSVAALPPLGQHMAIACDVAFAFLYPHLIAGWQAQGATLSFFSPLADEAPDASADAVYLPGGYPELHAGQLASNAKFRAGMLAAAQRDVAIYGECGGYMVLGDGLISADGTRHAMLGLLPLVTSFAQRKRHLGYRRIRPLSPSIFRENMTGHEFHYSVAVSEGEADRLFEAEDALGQVLGAVGLQRGLIAGSYMHVIDLDGARP
jgi:cobyrinic acid a,c-diamide synthase